jgi:hypothetical protein
MGGKQLCSGFSKSGTGSGNENDFVHVWVSSCKTSSSEWVNKETVEII